MTGGRRKRRRHYSYSFTATVEQIVWLRELPNASRLLRWLVEGAMAAGDFAGGCREVLRLEGLIDGAKRRVAGAEEAWRRGSVGEDVRKVRRDLKGLRERRRRAIARLVGGRDKCDK